MSDFRPADICEADIKWIEKAVAQFYGFGQWDLANEGVFLANRLRLVTGYTPELPNLHSVKV